jgi:hypothetical protein
MATQDIFNAVLAFDEETVKAKTQAELDGGTDIGTIFNDGLISAMDEVGERFSAGELFVPEMLMAAQAMKAGLKILKPHLECRPEQEQGRRGHRHGQGRPARHRQEPGLDDDGRGRLRGGRPGGGRGQREIRQDGGGKERRRDRPVGAADHDHAVHGEHGQGGQGGGHGHAHDHRRCAGDPGLCRPDRRRRLQCRRAGGGQAGQAAGGVSQTTEVG